MKIKQKFILLFSNPKKFVNKSFDKLKYFKRFYLDKEIFLIELKRWYKDNGDENLRLSYPSLNINSIVFDLGGYKGDFAFQIYADFSGYSDIAIGTARLFGFKLMRNFNYPYFSRDVAEFWRRWHISLSTWFRDYLYIPLGGSKGGKGIQIRNIFIIFLIITGCNSIHPIFII